MCYFKTIISKRKTIATIVLYFFEHKNLDFMKSLSPTEQASNRPSTGEKSYFFFHWLFTFVTYIV